MFAFSLELYLRSQFWIFSLFAYFFGMFYVWSLPDYILRFLDRF